ncbi:unnamed protein product, partial [Iphiclides podalirius]
MPAARGVKRTASKSSTTATATGPKNKKKRGAIQLEIPSAPKKRGRVFTCGQGDVGQLGLGEDVVETTKFKYVSALGDKIVDVCAGGMHTVALDTDGKVWTFGCNDEGALGRTTNSDKDEGTAKAVTLPRKAVAIAAGDSHSAALLDNGDVYAWGAFRDSHGSMGLVVPSGGDHLVVLSTTGSVYTMGCGEQGQLGRLSQRSASRDARQGFSALLAPSKVILKGGASRVWAGYHATFVLDANNDKMFAWGLNNYGQLGITGEKRKTAIFSPTECDAFTSANTSWGSVACGQHHSLALDSNGLVYAIGRTEYGRLGLGDRTGDAEILEPIPKLQNKKCVNIAAGTCNSFAVTDTGEVFAWGMGSEGQLGTGAAADALEPAPAHAAPFDGRPAARVAAGGQHTALLLEESKETSPAPESEKEEVEQQQEATEDSQESEKEKEKEKPKARPAKRQKKQEQDEEISSTSSAQASEVAETKPLKVNGDEQKETPMEVDETDKAEDKKDEEQTADTEKQSEEADKQSEDTEPEQEESKPDTMDTSSQGTTDSESKPMDSEEQKDEAMDRDEDREEQREREEVNGTERETVDSKMDSLIPSDNALTTSA